MITDHCGALKGRFLATLNIKAVRIEVGMTQLVIFVGRCGTALLMTMSNSENNAMRIDPTPAFIKRRGNSSTCSPIIFSVARYPAPYTQKSNRKISTAYSLKTKKPLENRLVISLGLKLLPPCSFVRKAQKTSAEIYLKRWGVFFHDRYPPSYQGERIVALIYCPSSLQICQYILVLNLELPVAVIDNSKTSSKISGTREFSTMLKLSPMDKKVEYTRKIS